MSTYISVEEPHNGKPITKMAISPQSTYIVTYSQDDRSFVGWRREGIDLIYDSVLNYKVYKKYYYNYYNFDFKVSDKKIIILNKECIYNMKNKKQVILDNDLLDTKCDFLKNGNIITCDKRVISIYSSSNNCDDWKRVTEYKLNEKDKIFGEVTNDKLLILVNKIIFILNLSTFQYWEVLLGRSEEEIDIEKIVLKFSNNLMIINVDGILHIYSKKMELFFQWFKGTGTKPIEIPFHMPIGNIKVDAQYFGIVGNNDEYIITLSNSNVINIHSWRQNLRKSIDLNNLLKSKIDQFSKIEFKDNKLALYLQNENNMTVSHIEFKDNEVTLYLHHDNKPRIINITVDWKDLLKDPEQDNSIQNSKVELDSSQSKEEVNDDNSIKKNDLLDKSIFYNIEKQLITTQVDTVNEDWFIKNHIFPSLKSEQNEYELRLKSDESFIKTYLLELILSSNQTKISSRPYNTKLKPEDWTYHKVSNNKSIFIENISKYISKKREMRIYTFNTKINKIQLQSCFNIEFLECAVKYYNNSKLDFEDINKIAELTENDGLKKQWNFYLLNQKYFLVHYGSELLKSAIERYNIELIETIINKTLKYFKENPDRNIYILSIICENMNYLRQKYPKFLLQYFNIMNLCIGSSNQNIIYSRFNHIHSFDIELNTYSSYSFSIFRSIRYIFFPIFKPNIKPQLKFIVPFPNYVTYPKNYNLFKELFFKPESSPFSQIQDNEFYKTWNSEAIINFKWTSFGRYYYAAIWFLFIIFLICFTLASSNEKENYNLLISSIILGFIHLSFEIRQFIWNPINWILNFWNFFDLGAYLLPTITSIYWIRTGIMNIPLVSISCLLLDIKFMLFFRAYELFGIYFAIVIGVGRRIFSFLLILFLTVISFAHAFLILLKPKFEFSENSQGNLSDPNNPWVLTAKYHEILEDGTINPNANLVQEPDENTNLFSSFPNSLLAVYLFLMGDRNSLAAWQPKDNPIMIILMVIFSFIIVVYLMNLFIGLLNLAIDKDNDRISYLAQKAEILKDIELFYLLPYQRRRIDWFPDIIYYYADVDKTQEAIKKLKDKGSWNSSSFIEMRERLLKILNIEDS